MASISSRKEKQRQELNGFIKTLVQLYDGNKSKINLEFWKVAKEPPYALTGNEIAIYYSPIVDTEIYLYKLKNSPKVPNKVSMKRSLGPAPTVPRLSEFQHKSYKVPTNMTINHQDLDEFLGFGYKSRKVSKKSRKASKKSRKASKKSRKASKKSRKASKKSRKASRKSRKASRKSKSRKGL